MNDTGCVISVIAPEPSRVKSIERFDHEQSRVFRVTRLREEMRRTAWSDTLELEIVESCGNRGCRRVELVVSLALSGRRLISLEDARLVFDDGRVVAFLRGDGDRPAVHIDRTVAVCQRELEP